MTPQPPPFLSLSLSIREYRLLSRVPRSIKCIHTLTVYLMTPLNLNLISTWCLWKMLPTRVTSKFMKILIILCLLAMSSAVSSWLVQTSLVLWMTVSRFQLSTSGLNVNHSLRTPKRKLSVRSEELKSRQIQKLSTKMHPRVSSIFPMVVGSAVAVRTTISLVAKSAIVVSKSRRNWTLMANQSTCSVTPTKSLRS